MHVVSAQFCAYLPSPNVPESLKGLTLLYAQTIATGKGIINLAKLQGLTFDQPYTDPHTNEVETVLVIKTQAKRPTISTSFYNKDARSRDMRQRMRLSESKAATVDENVRIDITLHSLGVKAVVRQARMRLKQLIKKDPTLAARFGKFQVGEPPSTVSALEQAIWILSVIPHHGKQLRRSFADWLIPYVLQDLLRLEVLTEFTVEGYEELLQSPDKVAVAWRTAAPAVDRWAIALAQKANVTLQTVYNRQAVWRKKYAIDIALPNAFYRDALYFGPNSVSTAKDRSATLAAHSARDGHELLRLRDKAALNFDRLRREVVGATIRAPLHLMPVEVGLINPTAPLIAPTAVSGSRIAFPSPPANVGQATGKPPLPADASPTRGQTRTGADVDPPLVNPPPAMALKRSPASPDVDEFDDLPPDFDDSDLDEAVLTRPVSARPTTKKSGPRIILRAARSPPSPPTVKKVVRRALRRLPPPAAKKLVLKVPRSPPPAPIVKKLMFPIRRSPLLPPTP